MFLREITLFQAQNAISYVYIFTKTNGVKVTIDLIYPHG